MILVLATEEKHSVREFIELSFKYVGIEISWKGEGVDEKGIDVSTGRELVCVDPKYFRPTEVELLLGDASKAKRLLGWQSSTSFKSLVNEMVEADIKLVKKHG